MDPPLFRLLRCTAEAASTHAVVIGHAFTRAAERLTVEWLGLGPDQQQQPRRFKSQRVQWYGKGTPTLM